MNTLSFPVLREKIARSPAVREILKAAESGAFPMEIDAVEGCFPALLISLMYRGGKTAVVVPTDTEAAALARDLQTAGLPVGVFPWWGTIPYRDMPALSAVFGERTGILASLASGSGGIVILPQRAFLTPLPPPEYIRQLLVTLEPGGTIDAIALAETLASYGYVRVPRVQVRGEFALRGEVLDILMGEETEAYRILFDFDRIESIRRFDPLNQSGLEKQSRLVIHPLKEVVWTDDRIEALSKTWKPLKSSLRRHGAAGRTHVPQNRKRRGTLVSAGL